MEIIDPGHKYLLESYDGDQGNFLVFMKRDGEGYPGNIGSHAGTNCQEVLRALIARVQYLHRQIPSEYNVCIIRDLRDALLQFELRAAYRHGRQLAHTDIAIEHMETCQACGHIACDGMCRQNTLKYQGEDAR
jgi:hypothetical protein